MAKKKVSDTIAQQRKARQDFLDLKKMQHGEMETGPKPSEVAVKPITLKEKWQNFWFHSKWQTIAVIFTIISMVILIGQCASRKDWDMQVVYFTYTPVIDEQTAEIEDYLESISKDLNGDGEVNIKVRNLSVSLTNGNAQYTKNALSTLHAYITTEEEALLFITDSESATHFEKDAIKNFFGTEQVKLNEKFYKETKSEDFGTLPKGLQIACRRVDDTIVEKKTNVGKIHNESLRILDELKKEN